ncbi:hypothetical protein L7F22_008888 [Adiantum nelumboides]|nr:hypothetical protein [Adiantum nelumboides]
MKATCRLSEKLTEDNFHAWKFRIKNYLKGKGYWDYVEDSIVGHIHDADSPKDDLDAKVMYWLSVSVLNSIVGDIHDANSPKDAWDNLIAFNATNTRARKIQLKNELNTIKQGDLSVNDYTLKIKDLCESLSSIGVAMDDDDMVEAYLRGLGNAYKQFKTYICTRENIPIFKSCHHCWLLRKRALLTMKLFKQEEIALNKPFTQVQEEVEGVMHKEVAVEIKVKANSNSKTSKTNMVRKGLCVVENSSEVGEVLVEVVVIKETMENNRGQHNNYASTSRNTDDTERLFVYQFRSNIVSESVSTLQDDNVWYVDSGDDTAHLIAHTGDVPLSTKNGKEKYLVNGDGLYIEEYKKNGKLIAQGKKVGRMFTLNVNMPERSGEDVAENSDVQSQVLSGPQGSPTSNHVENPWSEKLRKEVSPTSSNYVSRKCKEKVDEGMRMPNVTTEHDEVDGVTKW